MIFQRLLKNEHQTRFFCIWCFIERSILRLIYVVIVEPHDRCLRYCETIDIVGRLSLTNESHKEFWLIEYGYCHLCIIVEPIGVAKCYKDTCVY